MKNIYYMTLADVRNIDSVAFDAAIKLAFEQAVSDVGEQIAIQALCGHQQIDTKEIYRAA
jgi:hypothetical protein